MKYLFIHQNFPGQFLHIAAKLAELGHEVRALSVNQPTAKIPGVTMVHHKPGAVLIQPGHPWNLSETESKLARGASAASAMQSLKKSGFTPDVVFAHPGWGEAYFAKDVFPDARLLVYGEYYYGGADGDLGFDEEFAAHSEELLQRVRFKNTHLLHALSVADAVLSPTEFQKRQHPVWVQNKTTVVHDGIRTAQFRPDPHASVRLQKAGLALRPGDEVVTYVARELEPYRGFHTFMRSLPNLLSQRPNVQVVVVGGEGVSYGSAPPRGKGKSWKEVMMRELGNTIDLQRVHFVGKVPHRVLTELLQVSAAHIYLTYPFVLSWSMLEAMSIGCLVVGSNTGPVQEVITPGVNGHLVDFFDPIALASRVAWALEHRAELGHIRAAARQTVVDRFDLETHCLPRWVQFSGA